MLVASVCQKIGAARLVATCSAKTSLVGASQVSRIPPLVETVRLMNGTGLTMTANELVALNGGAPPSVTIVVKRLLVPACATPGVQVMMPLVLMTGRFVPTTVLDKV